MSARQAPAATDLRLMVYDRTCRGRGLLPGLTHSWIAGALLYQGLGRLDAAFAASSWAEAFAHLLDASAGRRIAEVQYWGHGKWGRAYVARDVLDEGAFLPSSPHYDALSRLRDRFTDDALVWFRTCETFGKREGVSFATALTTFTGARGAGHTYVIGPWQSGLHALSPGETPTWPLHEGLPDGDAAAKKALMSTPWAPNTITCLHGAVPAGF
jgi:hypothetical protein